MGFRRLCFRSRGDCAGPRVGLQRANSFETGWEVADSPVKIL